MIAFYSTDYTFYFEDADIETLKGDKSVTGEVQNAGKREPIIFELKNPDDMYDLSKKKDDLLVFSDATNKVAVHWSSGDGPTTQWIYFEKDWFLALVEDTIRNKKDSKMIRWNGSGDKIHILAGVGSESKRFKMMFGD